MTPTPYLHKYKSSLHRSTSTTPQLPVIHKFTNGRISKKSRLLPPRPIPQSIIITNGQISEASGWLQPKLTPHRVDHFATGSAEKSSCSDQKKEDLAQQIFTAWNAPNSSARDPLFRIYVVNKFNEFANKVVRNPFNSFSREGANSYLYNFLQQQSEVSLPTLKSLKFWLTASDVSALEGKVWNGALLRQSHPDYRKTHLSSLPITANSSTSHHQTLRNLQNPVARTPGSLQTFIENTAFPEADAFEPKQSDDFLGIFTKDPFPGLLSNDIQAIIRTEIAPTETIEDPEFPPGLFSDSDDSDSEISDLDLNNVNFPNAPEDFFSEIPYTEEELSEVVREEIV